MAARVDAMELLIMNVFGRHSLPPWVSLCVFVHSFLQYFDYFNVNFNYSFIFEHFEPISTILNIFRKLWCYPDIKWLSLYLVYLFVPRYEY